MVTKRFDRVLLVVVSILLAGPLLAYADESTRTDPGIYRTALRVLSEEYTHSLVSLVCQVSESGDPIGLNIIVEPICQVSIVLPWLEHRNDRPFETSPGAKTEARKYRAPSTKTQNRRRESPAAALIDFNQSTRSR
jgi:hypothetical protein